MVVKDSRPLVETSRMPGVRELELLQVKVMAELMAQSAEERSVRSDLFLHRRSHPEPDEHRFRVVVPEEFGCPIFTSVEWSGGEYADAADRDFVGLRCLGQKFRTCDSDICCFSGLHRRFDRLRN